MREHPARCLLNATCITGKAMRFLRFPALFLTLLFVYATPAPAPKARESEGAREPGRAGAPSRRAGIAARDAQADFKIMHKIFAEAHATAFRQIPSGAAPELFKGDKPVLIREFITQVLKYYRGIHVDHTGIGFSPEVIDDLDLKRALFPFPLRFFARQGDTSPGTTTVRAFLDCDTADIPFAAELATINGKSITAILADLESVSGLKNAGGEWDEFRLQENFSFIYYLRYGAQPEWAIEFRPQGETALRGLNYRVAQIRNPQPVMRRGANHPQMAQPLFTMFNPSVKGAYLAINSFMPAGGMLDSVDSWNNHLNLFHQEARAKKSEYLVIDLRLNRGGVMLFSAAAAAWFIEQPVADKSRSRAHSRAVASREYVAAINGEAITDEHLKNLNLHLQNAYADTATDGYYDTRQKDIRYLNIPTIEVSHKFKKIYILTGPATYSAAVNFARTVKLGNKNAILVGEETGSAGSGHAADFLVTYKLPATGLLFEVPIIDVIFAPLIPGQKPERGLMPDMPVRESIAEFAASRDAVLEAASRAMVNP